MRPPANHRELTREQIQALQAKVGPMLRFLRLLLTRVEQCHFPADDKLRREITAAYDAVHGLNVTLHYLSCDAMKREQETRPRRPWESGGRDTYWESRQKRKG